MGTFCEFAATLSIKTITNGVRKNTNETEKGKARLVREGFFFWSLCVCRNYDAARVRIIQARPSVPWPAALSRFL